MDEHFDVLFAKIVAISFTVIVIAVLFVSLRNPKPLISDEFGEYIEIHYQKACINNKEFIVHSRGITINLDTDGKSVVCSHKKGK